ncbi:unnamed protein product [Danaus chrysippus]|uniref:(African queen) hypothetical protein n=1 Tax=Danaus chrysippus TaxID=151541 RepID=A0A8J2QG45_9NEOP|nr:unnamed protein product [Danaus chrysippus]
MWVRSVKNASMQECQHTPVIFKIRTSPLALRCIRIRMRSEPAFEIQTCSRSLRYTLSLVSSLSFCVKGIYALISKKLQQPVELDDCDRYRRLTAGAARAAACALSRERRTGEQRGVWWGRGGGQRGPREREERGEEGEGIRHATRRNIRCISASGHLLRRAEVIRAKTKLFPKFPNLVKDNSPFQAVLYLNKVRFRSPRGTLCMANVMIRPISLAPRVVVVRC